jgi:uncharacterized damage-inducible protein DinB
MRGNNVDEKNVLLARLATERAGLWWELIGLSEEALTTQPVSGDWTPKDVLAHLAAWDEINTGRVRLALAGRAAEIPYLDPDATNAQLYAERGEWSLSRAVQACQTARADFLALLEPLIWDEMTRPYTLGGGDSRSVLEWAERRARHDAMHIADLRAWREAAGLNREAGPKVVLEAALEAGRAELLAWATLVPEAERAARPVCGVWTLKDVLGHVADWELFCLAGLREMAAGQVAGLSYNGDEEGWNQAHAAARRDQRWEAVWADFTDTRQALLAALAALDDADLNRSVPSRWDTDDRPYWWFRVCLGHDREHAEVLRAAVERLS